MILCVECRRVARWVWGGNRYEAPRFLCGYHKRAYVNVFNLIKEKK